MSRRVSFVLLLIGLVVCIGAQSDPPVPPPTTTSPAPTTSTTAAPKTTTTTAPATTTTTSSTTAAPSTTTSAPTPAPTPRPVPAPEIGNWTYTDKSTNQTCIIAQMAMQLNVSYFDTANKSVSVLYDLPTHAIVQSGQCSNQSQYIMLYWGEPVTMNYNSLTISFERNNTVPEFALTGVVFALNISGLDFPNARANQSLTLSNKAVLFKTPLDMSYHCNKAQQLNLTSSQTDLPQSYVTVSKLQLEAFHTKHNGKFSIAKDCDAIDTPDIVPIAVGCALVLLIVIMLIAYLVGRNHTSSQGYLSM